MTLCFTMELIKELYPTYDPGNDQHLHPGERGCFHAEQLCRMVTDGHVWKESCPFEPICRIHNQESEEDGE